MYNTLNLKKIYFGKGKHSLWSDYKWQLENCIRDIETFEKVTGIILENKNKLKKVIKKFPLKVTPYYISLIDKDNYEADPIFKQAIPNPRELEVAEKEMKDPLLEEKNCIVENLIHRYPDRVLFIVNNTCSIHCRHCTRKRMVGDRDFIRSRDVVERGIEYILNTPSVRDVLISGGDPLLLPEDYLDWILTEIKKIPHVELIRIGTRVPATLPFRITEGLVSMLRKHQPLWINTQFNHPKELTASASESIEKLVDSGFPLNNQTVLLAGVNDCPRIIKTLMHKLVKNRVRPYYLYQCDLCEGLSHFRTPISTGLNIIEHLRGHTSGFAVPTYVIDAPGGVGKIPVEPEYLLSWESDKIILRNYKGIIVTYKETNNHAIR